MLVLCLCRALAEKDDLELKKQIAYTHNGLGILCMHSAEYDKVSLHTAALCQVSFDHLESHATNESVQEQRIALYKSDQQ